MRKFLLKVSIFVMYALLLNVALPIWVDPFNVFHAEHIRANGVEPNKNYIKMKYILANPDKYDSFLFGSSRVGVIHTDKIADEKCYNMTYPMGLPAWHLLNIKTFLKNGIYPRKIYIGVDVGAYGWNHNGQINSPMCCPYEYLADDTFHFMKLYLDSAMMFRSLITMLDDLASRTGRIDTAVFYEHGWGVIEEYNKKFNWEKVDASPNIPRIVNGEKADIDSTLVFIREIADICKENNIELIIFTNPMHRIMYLASVMYAHYFNFLEGLAEISYFWNFSSLNDITLNNDNYHETNHYRSKIGDMMINVMCNGKSYSKLQSQGFGVKVTRENAKKFIAMLQKQFEDYNKSHQ